MRRINVGNSKLRARTNWFLLRHHVKKAARTQALLKKWYAPPKAVYGRRGYFKTGGGPGYRLALARSGRFFKK